MIAHIVLVVQGENEIGFLEGLHNRMGCRAELTHYLPNHPELRQRGHYTGKSDARNICRTFQAVDLIIRLSDSDAERPQDACREELSRWPEAEHARIVCGICDRDIEHWISLDVKYAARCMHFDPAELPGERKDRSGFLKNQIDKARGEQTRREFVAGFVHHAPAETIRLWLRNPAFELFYSECVRAAKRQDCGVNDERK